jgi:hypothetical protein
MSVSSASVFGSALSTCCHSCAFSLVSSPRCTIPCQPNSFCKYVIEPRLKYSVLSTKYCRLNARAAPLSHSHTGLSDAPGTIPAPPASTNTEKSPAEGSEADEPHRRSAPPHLFFPRPRHAPQGSNPRGVFRLSPTTGSGVDCDEMNPDGKTVAAIDSRTLFR